MTYFDEKVKAVYPKSNLKDNAVMLTSSPITCGNESKLLSRNQSFRILSSLPNSGGMLVKLRKDKSRISDFSFLAFFMRFRAS